MEKCQKCGNVLKRGQKFCTKCGTKIEFESIVNLSSEIVAKIDILKKKISNDNLNTSLYNELADVYFENHMYKEAILEYQKSLSINNEKFVPNLKVGIAYQKSNIFAKAEQFLRKALEIDPSSKKAICSLFWSLFYQSKYEDAIKLEKEIAIEDRTLEFHSAMKTAYIQLNCNQQAFEEMIKIDKINPNNLDNLKDLANQYEVKNEKEKFIKLHYRILSIESTNITSRFIIGKEAFFNKDYKKTLELFGQYIRSFSDSKYLIAYFYLAYAYIQLNEIEIAIDKISFIEFPDLKNASEKEKNIIADTYWLLGNFSFKQNKYSEASRFIDSALEFEPENIDFKNLLNSIESKYMETLNKRRRKKNSLKIGIISIILILIISVIFINYNKQEKEWIIAKNENTPTSYQNYIIRYPEGRFLNEAIELKEDAFWEDTLKDNSIEAFKVYIISYPFGKYIKEARAGTKVTDYDGNVYNTVIIGSQVWMIENLKVTHYLNGDHIPNVTDDAKWAKLKTGAWCYYENESGNNEPFGKLYNWYAVDDIRNLCPPGWHIPSFEDWQTLIDFLGGYKVAGLKMKSVRYWSKERRNQHRNNNQSRFSALPGGYRRSDDGKYTYANMEAYYWSSTEASNRKEACYILLHYSYARVYLDTYGYSSKKSSGFSVRCIRD